MFGPDALYVPATIGVNKLESSELQSNLFISAAEQLNEQKADEQKFQHKYKVQGDLGMHEGAVYTCFIPKFTVI